MSGGGGVGREFVCIFGGVKSLLFTPVVISHSSSVRRPKTLFTLAFFSLSLSLFCNTHFSADKEEARANTAAIVSIS